MPSELSSEEWYEREHAKQKGREDAKDEAARRRQREKEEREYEEYRREQAVLRAIERAERRRRTVRLVGCLAFLVIGVAGCGGLVAFAVFSAGRPTSPSGTVPTRATEREHKPPATVPAVETLPRPVTLTPPVGGTLVLCKLPQADRSAEAVKLGKATGLVRDLAEPTAVILLARYADECKVRYDGADWFVPSSGVPAK